MIYLGLDLYGGDLHSLHTPEIGACAMACLDASLMCSAFTYNVAYTPGFDNCFLKDDNITPDGNEVAISGILLRPEDGSPPVYRVGVIDPARDVMRGKDLPGGDLSRNPANAVSAQGCRLACVRDSSCYAFTFVESTRQCWLKGSVGRLRDGYGMVSGVKTLRNFTPEHVIRLD